VRHASNLSASMGSASSSDATTTAGMPATPMVAVFDCAPIMESMHRNMVILVILLSIPAGILLHVTIHVLQWFCPWRYHVQYSASMAQRAFAAVVILLGSVYLVVMFFATSFLAMPISGKAGWLLAFGTAMATNTWTVIGRPFWAFVGLLTALVNAIVFYWCAKPGASTSATPIHIDTINFPTAVKPIVLLGSNEEHTRDTRPVSRAQSTKPQDALPAFQSTPAADGPKPSAPPALSGSEVASLRSALDKLCAGFSSERASSDSALERLRIGLASKRVGSEPDERDGAYSRIDESDTA